MHKYVQIMYTTNHTIHKYHIYTYKDHSFIHTDHSYIHTKVYLHAHAHTYIHTYIHTNITHSSIRDTHMHIIYIYTYGHGVFILTTSPKGKWHTIQNPLWNKDDIKMWLWTVSQPPCGRSLSPTGCRYQYPSGRVGGSPGWKEVLWAVIEAPGLWYEGPLWGPR